jgi:murein DD-endopeptidase MepM/ murein hydrolase activator NlpD
LQTHATTENIFRGPAPPAVLVQRGDTVYALSRRYGVPVKDIIRANQLLPPYILHVGDRLVLPRPQVYVVQRGDTLYGIAQVYGVDMRDLAGLNRLGSPYTIWIGQRLALPSQAEIQVASSVRVAAQPVPQPSVPSASFAPSSSVSPSPAAVSQSGAGRTVAPFVGASAAAPQASVPVTPIPKPTPTTTSKASAPQPDARAAQPPQPPPRAGRTFAWPVKGTIIGRYGPSTAGTRNDGINIAVEKGTQVRAAENGVIVYAGNELKGFGNLLLVKHSDGWMTAYAHNETLIAKRGDTVRRGQVIAKAGQSGNVDSPQVHFEVRRNSKAVDPLEYLERSVATR